MCHLVSSLTMIKLSKFNNAFLQVFNFFFLKKASAIFSKMARFCSDWFINWRQVSKKKGMFINGSCWKSENRFCLRCVKIRPWTLAFYLKRIMLSLKTLIVYIYCRDPWKLSKWQIYCDVKEGGREKTRIVKTRREKTRREKTSYTNLAYFLPIGSCGKRK